jgi:dienelactone hydrolase
MRWLRARLVDRESASEADWAIRMAPFVRRYQPEQRAQKYPVLLLMHGCAGDFPHLEHWAQLLASEGYLVYTVDSLTPRNIRSWQAHCLVCTGLRLTGFARRQDITAVLSVIRRDPEADLDRLGLIGWSHGGWTIMEWLHDPAQTQILHDAGMTLAALIFVYPYCGFASVIHLQSWPAPAPVLIVTAERDRTVSNKTTERLVRRLRDLDLRAILITMPGARHAFDLSYKNSFDAERTADLQREILHCLNQEMNHSMPV